MNNERHLETTTPPRRETPHIFHTRETGIRVPVIENPNVRRHTSHPPATLVLNKRKETPFIVAGVKPHKPQDVGRTALRIIALPASGIAFMGGSHFIGNGSMGVMAGTINKENMLNAPITTSSAVGGIMFAIIGARLWSFARGKKK
ncbi:MAG: hypothetical protein WC880_02105 [Candidatus Paceibacterota bacterium]